MIPYSQDETGLRGTYLAPKSPDRAEKEEPLELMDFRKSLCSRGFELRRVDLNH